MSLDYERLALLLKEVWIKYNTNFAREEMVLHVGDQVLYGKYSGTGLEHDGKKYLIMRQSDVLAVLG